MCWTAKNNKEEERGKTPSSLRAKQGRVLTLLVNADRQFFAQLQCDTSTSTINYKYATVQWLISKPEFMVATAYWKRQTNHCRT